jgi:hypothetical protein
MAKALTIEDMRALAESREGEFLSEIYVNSSTKHEWRCAQGHTWSAIPNSIARGSWCPQCSGRRKLGMKEMQEAAAKHGGECLSSAYVNSRTKLRWRCRLGHEWDAVYNSIFRGTWCPECGLERRKKASNERKTIEDMQRLATARLGSCVSTEYHNMHTKLQWMCEFGHTWWAKPNCIQQGRWCPHCAGVAPLSLDEMQEIGVERGGECLAVEYFNTKTALPWICADGHTWDATPDNIKSGTWCPFCAPNTRVSLLDMQAIAVARGGECLSRDYKNTRARMSWRCAKGHRWRATADGIRSGSWCPRCAGTKRLTIGEMRRLAKRKSGLCLSTEYINAWTHLDWQCVKGHTWKAVPVSIKHGGTWCPYCYREVIIADALARSSGS